MQNIAQPWLAYSITKSPFLLSLVSMLQFAPVLLFSLFAGVLIDKFSKKKILLLTQSASIVITLSLAILVWTGNVQYWHILVLATILGVVNTLDMPARQSFVIELVGKEDLMNAIALNSSLFNIARVVGPAIAGIVMGSVGLAACFFANAISFTAVVISLIFIKPLDIHKVTNKGGKILTDITDGLKYIRHNEILFDTVLYMAVMGIFVMNFNVLVPVFAKEVLHQEETGFGFLMSFLGLGSFIGAMFVAAISNSNSEKAIKFILNIVPFITSAFLIITGLTRNYLLAGVCLALTGIGFVAFTSTANSTMQINAKNEYRGRVMSVYALLFAGSTPIGNLYAGLIDEHFGGSAGFIACGAVSILLLIPVYIYKAKSKGIVADKNQQEGIYSG